MKNFKFFSLLIIGFISFNAFADEPKNKKTTKTKAVIFDIFGNNFAYTPIVSNKLNGHVYYLISGHGGPDPGAMALKNGKMLCEDEYAYDVTLRLARNLLSNGAKVYVINRDENDGIRESDYLEYDKDEQIWGNQSIPLSQSKRLKQRTDIINKLFVENKKAGYETQRVIETHIDSRYPAQKVDIFFYYNENSNEGRKLANQMYSTIKTKYDEVQKGRGYSGIVKSRDLHTIRESKPTALYIELGNIANEEDQKRLLIAITVKQSQTG